MARRKDLPPLPPAPPPVQLTADELEARAMLAAAGIEPDFTRPALAQLNAAVLLPLVQSPLWTVDEACRYLKISRSTWNRLVADGQTPPYSEPFGRILMLEADVRAWGDEIHRRLAAEKFAGKPLVPAGPLPQRLKRIAKKLKPPPDVGMPAEQRKPTAAELRKPLPLPGAFTHLQEQLRDSD